MEFVSNSALGYINASHSKFADGWIKLTTNKGAKLFLIIQSKRVQTITDQSVQETTLSHELDVIFGKDWNGSTTLQSRTAQYIFMLITDRNSIFIPY